MLDMQATLAGERPGTRYIRHFGHIKNDVVLLADGAVMAVLEVEGFPYELAGNRALNAKHTLRAALLRNIADDDTELYEHLIQHDAVPSVAGGVVQHPTAYGAELALDYETACLNGLRSVTWLLTITVSPRVIRPTLRSLFGMPPTEEGSARQRQPGPALDKRVSRLEDRVRATMSAMQPYGVRRLGVRFGSNGLPYSEIAEAHRLALYAEWQPVPMVAPAALAASIYTTRVVTGGGLGNGVFRVEREGVPAAYSHTMPHGAMIGFRIYPHPWRVGMFDKLIGQPFRFVLTNSYRFHSRSAAGDKLAAKARRMTNAGDRAVSLREGLSKAMDEVESGENVRGKHHFSLAVHANCLADLEEITAMARAAMADAGAVVAIEDFALEAAFFAQMPGSPAYLRARAGSISSVAMAALSSFHAPARGDKRHHWGRPIYRLRTSNGTAYDRGWHLRDVGHTLRIGPTGSGKSLSLGFDVAMLDPLVGGQGGTQIVLDKDESNRIVVQALGGPYAVLRRGHPCTAPLRALPNTPDARSWLHQFITGLAMADGRGAPTPQESARLATGLEFIMRLPVGMRSIAGLREFLGREDAVGFGARLETWARGGARGWAFDADEDPIDFDARVAGVDPTAIMPDEAVMPPMAAYLLHRAALVMDGRRAVLHADEFKYYLPDPRFARAFEDFALTGRKKNWSLDIATQQPEHILDHPIGASLVAQCKTRLLYRNPDAREVPYMDGLGCTAREFRAVSGDMLAGPHSLLIKREDRSVLCRFDFSTLPDHIAILSGTAQSVRLLDDIQAEHGMDPSVWLPIFRNRVRSLKA